jgi:hypothetical protein
MQPAMPACGLPSRDGLGIARISKLFGTKLRYHPAAWSCRTYGTRPMLAMICEKRTSATLRHMAQLYETRMEEK